MPSERKRKRGASNATGDGEGNGGGSGNVGSKGEQEVTPQAAGNHIEVDLNSKSATNVANIVFRGAQQWNSPIVQFESHDSLGVCECIREWLKSAGPPDIKPLIRIENQELNLIGPDKKGILLFFEDTAMLDGDRSAPITVFSLYIPSDKHIRYFWTLLSPSPLLTDLTIRGLIGPPSQMPCSDNPPRRSKAGVVLPSRHHMLLTFVAQSFHDATTFPDSADYRTASLISDLCPSIRDLATAWRRINAEDELHRSVDDGGKNLDDDRYTSELHSAERELASLVHVNCARYLLLKRQYFKSFSRETVLHGEKVRRAAAHYQNERQRLATPNSTPDNNNGDANDDSPALTPRSSSSPRTTRSRGISVTPISADPMDYHVARSRAAQAGATNRALRVRTKHAHFRAFEALSGWNFARSKRLITGWEILGFLDEERVLAVLDGEYDG
jgi:hypothetical protein